MSEIEIEAEFNAFLEKAPKKDPIIIAMHDTPDPDAMGSAVGMQFMLKTLGRPSVIIYSGEVSHPQNKTLINVLNLSFQKRKPAESFEGDHVICVDGVERNTAGVMPALVIDHHKNVTAAPHQIINPAYGSCSTLVYMLMRKVLKEEWHRKDAVMVYTALLLGIRTDTNDLTSENMSIEDFNAYQELLAVADKEALQKVMNYPLPRYMYDHRLALHREGNSYETNGTFVGGIGYITASQRDAIAVLAEEYARMESVNTSVIFAIVDKSTLQVSVRSSNVSLDVGAMCSDLFGDFGGGTSYKGGASIPLGFYQNIDNGEREMFWDVTVAHMFRKVLQDAYTSDLSE